MGVLCPQLRNGSRPPQDARSVSDRSTMENLNIERPLMWFCRKVKFNGLGGRSSTLLWRIRREFLDAALAIIVDDDECRRNLPIDIGDL